MQLINTAVFVHFSKTHCFCLFLLAKKFSGDSFWETGYEHYFHLENICISRLQSWNWDSRNISLIGEHMTFLLKCWWRRYYVSCNSESLYISSYWLVLAIKPRQQKQLLRRSSLDTSPWVVVTSLFTILSLYWKIRVRQNLYSAIFSAENFAYL